ncbi:MAG: hypothetical protein NZ523_09530 [Elioraea sp.]|nr:hypothetical protein [Elioraea sp.]
MAAGFAVALLVVLAAGFAAFFAGCFVVLLATARVAERAAARVCGFGVFAVVSRPRVVRRAATLLSLAALLLVDFVAIVPSKPVSRLCASPKTPSWPAGSRAAPASADRGGEPVGSRHQDNTKNRRFHLPPPKRQRFRGETGVRGVPAFR